MGDNSDSSGVVSIDSDDKDRLNVWMPMEIEVELEAMAFVDDAEEDATAATVILLIERTIIQ